MRQKTWLDIGVMSKEKTARRKSGGLHFSLRAVTFSAHWQAGVA
jgi:hypothetical protein